MEDDVDWRTRGCEGGVDQCDTLADWESFKMGYTNSSMRCVKYARPARGKAEQNRHGGNRSISRRFWMRSKDWETGI
jgi:hypothetical protein